MGEEKMRMYEMKKHLAGRIQIIAVLALACACFLCGCSMEDIDIVGKQLMGQTLHASEKPLLVRAESYDTDGNPLETWDYSYDEKDRLLQVICKQANPDTGEMTLFETCDYEYFKDGTYQQSIVYSIESQETHLITYDAKERETYNVTDLLRDGEPTHIEFVTNYEQIGETEVATIAAADGSYSYATQQTRNKQGDVVSYKLTDPQGTESEYTTEYTYDKQGRILSQTQSDGAGMRTVRSCEYEGKSDKPTNEVQETFLGSGEAEVSVAKQTKTYVYDAQGHLTEEDYAYDDAAEKEGMTGRLGKVLYFYQE